MILQIGATQNVQAQILGPDSNPIPFTDPVVWTSDRADLVSIGPTAGDPGNTQKRTLTAVAAGNAIITATVQGLLAATLAVQVIPAGSTVVIVPA